MSGDLGMDGSGLDYSTLGLDQRTSEARLPFWDALGESAAENTNLFNNRFTQTLDSVGAAFTDVTEPGLVDTDALNKQYSDLGLHFTPDMSLGSINLLIKNKAEEKQREAALADAPSDFMFNAARLGTSLAVSATDPLNVAAAFVPVVGESRYGLWAARYGKTIARALQGGVEGGVGMAALQPVEMLHAHDYQDEYTAFDAFSNVAFGTVLGGGLHAGLGKISDLLGRAAPETREGALRSAVGQMAEGREVDVSPVMASDPVTSEFIESPAGPAHEADPFDGLIPDTVAEPTAEDVASARTTVVEARSAMPKEASLLDTIRSLGGLKLKDGGGNRLPEASEIEAALKDYKRPGLINNKGGMTADYMREALAEQGWLPQDSDLNDLYTLLSQEAQGSKVYHPDSTMHGVQQYRALLDQELSEAGVAKGDNHDVAAGKVAAYRASQKASDFADAQERAVAARVNDLSEHAQEVLRSHDEWIGSDEWLRGEQEAAGGVSSADAGQEPQSHGPGAGGQDARGASGNSPVSGESAQSIARGRSREFAANREPSTVEPSPEAAARVDAELKAGDDIEAELADAQARIQAYHAQGIISDAELAKLTEADAADSEAFKTDGDAAQAAARCLFLHP